MLEPEKAKPETEVAKPEVVPRTDCPRKFKLINCTNATKYYTLLGYFTLVDIHFLLRNLAGS